MKAAGGVLRQAKGSQDVNETLSRPSTRTSPSPVPGDWDRWARKILAKARAGAYLKAGYEIGPNRRDPVAQAARRSAGIVEDGRAAPGRPGRETFSRQLMSPLLSDTPDWVSGGPAPGRVRVLSGRLVAVARAPLEDDGPKGPDERLTMLRAFLPDSLTAAVAGWDAFRADWPASRAVGLVSGFCSLSIPNMHAAFGLIRRPPRPLGRADSRGERVFHGKQNDHRRLPSGRDPGGGAER